MDQHQNYSSEITEKILSFVDQIEAVLLSHQVPRAQRTNICDEVESQIHTMISRRLESGAELNLELVVSIIESMDQPESYALMSDASRLTPLATEPEAQPVGAVETPPTSAPAARKRLKFDSIVPAFVKKRFNATPHFDLFAIVGLAMVMFGLTAFLLGMVGRHPHGEIIVFGMSLLFLGTVANAISFWRIRQSSGRLLGIRYASIGMLVLPILLANALLFGLVFGTRLWMFLGGLAVTSGILYGNFRLVRWALNWLETSTIGESLAPAAQTPTGDEEKVPEPLGMPGTAV